MTDSSAEARPGRVPGVRSPVGSMFAAPYGELAPHPWRDAETDRDAYALFYDRSLAEWSLDALGWLGGFLADLSAGQGIITPLLLTASRS